MSRYRQTMSELLNKVRGIKEQNNDDHEVSMARGELEATADKALKLSSLLKDKLEAGNPIEAWVQSKITKAAEMIATVHDYMIYNPEINEQLKPVPSVEDIAKKHNVSVDRVKSEIEKGSKVEKEHTTDQATAEKIATAHVDELIDYYDRLKKVEEAKEPYGWTLVSKAKDLAKKFANNMTKAVAEIEKLQKGLSDNPEVYKELLKYNEEVELEEGRMKDIYQMQQDGKSAEEIAKYLKLSVQTVKGILGEEKIEEETLEEFTSNQINDLKKSYADLKGKTISPEKATALSKHLDRIDVDSLRQLIKANIPFVSTLARNKVYKKTGKFEQLEEQESDGVEIAKIRAQRDKEDKKEVANKDQQIETLKGQVSLLKQKLENEKNKAIKPEPNPNTGEVPLTIGIANKLIKDKEEKLAQKKEVKEDRRLYIESIAAVKNKAEKTGMPYSVLKQVYDRGMAAWKGGHRPGAGQVQWALARVNSFVTKSSGTWGGADKDLAAKVKGSK